MIRILHLADLHLGWEPPWPEIAPERRRERDERLARAVDWALGNRIDAVLIVGDLFETHRPEAALVKYAMGELARLVEHGVAVVTVPGNHDEISYLDSVYRAYAAEWPGVLVTSPHLTRAASFRTRGGDLHVDSLAYTAGVTRASEPISRFPRGDEPGYHVVALHGSLDFSAGDRSLPIDRRAIAAAGYHYAALGHIHKRLATPGPFPVAYAGMIEGKGFDDPGTGCYTVATLTPAGTALEYVDAGARRVLSVEVDAGAFESFASLAEACERQVGPGDIARVVLAGARGYPIDAARLASRLGAVCRFALVEDRTESLPEDLSAVATEPTLRGAFAAKILARLDGAAGREEKLLRRALALGLAALGRERDG